MKVKLVLTLLRWTIGGLFIYAGALKVWDTQQLPSICRITRSPDPVMSS